MSFIAEKIIMDGLTFDDVLLVPAYSEVLPREVNLSTRFSRNIKLNIPFVSAAMDTVTEAKLAIAIAREGGIGVIHKNMTIEQQAQQVRYVKRAENGMISNPVSILKEKTVGEALALMAEYKIGGIPVVNSDNYLVGIVTNRDLRFQRDMDKLIDEVMTKENLITTSRSTDMEAATDILQQYKIEKLPVVDENNVLIGLLTFKDIAKIKANPTASKDEKGRLMVAAGVGIAANTEKRIEALINAQVDAIVIDTAHGHHINIAQLLKKVKNTYPTLQVVVGNIATAEAAKYLIDAGADAVISHHSHCYSGYEIYHSKPIFYGLGNFCFDWEGIWNRPWNYGYAVELLLGENGIINYSIYPYKQGNELPGIVLLNEQETVSFNKTIEDFNHIISDTESLNKEFETFINKHAEQYMLILEPYSNKYFKALRTRKLLPSFVCSKNMLGLLNMVRCESHRDIIIRALKNRT